MQVKALSLRGVLMDIKINNGSMICDWMIGVVLAKILLARVWGPALVCSRKVASSAAQLEFSNSRILAKPSPSNSLPFARGNIRYLERQPTSPP
jgi:hypothetical protein